MFQRGVEMRGTASLLAIIFLALVALFHLLRLAFGVEVTADGRTIPVWLSAFGVLVPGTLAALLWRERQGWSGGGHPGEVAARRASRDDGSPRAGSTG